MNDELRTPQWWLAELDQHGNPKLIDGSHSDRAGADQAAYIIGALGLGGTNRRFAVARVELSEVLPNSAGVNHEAVATMAPLVAAYKGKATQ